MSLRQVLDAAKGIPSAPDGRLNAVTALSLMHDTCGVGGWA